MKAELGYLGNAQGSVLLREMQDEHNADIAYVVSISGPSELANSKNELYDKCHLKVHVNPLNGPPSYLDGELAYKVREIFSSVLKLSEFPRSGLYIGIQPAKYSSKGRHLDFALVVNAVTLALVNASFPMNF